MLTLASFADLDLILIIIGSVIVGIGVICAIVAVFLAVKNGRPPERRKFEKGDNVVSADEYLEEIEVRNEQLILVRNVIYSVGTNGQIAHGSYTISNAIENGGAMNVRFNGLVREIEDGTKVILTEGDTICCVSGSAALKAV